MVTTVRVEEGLVTKAVKLGKHPNKTAAVMEALREYIEHIEQLDILNAFGTIDYDPNYDYKKQRMRE